MPAFQVESVDELAFPQLLRLVFKKLAVDYYNETDGHELWLDEEASELHARLYSLRDRIGRHLPPLERVHFLDTDESPHPYSREIAQALDILQQSGAVKRENPQYRWVCPTVYDDSQEVIEDEIDRLFPTNSPEREAFGELVRELSALRREE